MSPSTPVTTVPVSIGESSYNEHIDTGNGIDVDLKEEMMLMITNGVPSSSSSSTNHQHGIYKPRSHARSKSPVLKRVSFGSSKGSMVETLIYDHSEEDLLRDKFNSKDNPSERYLNGNHLNHYNQPIHFHYPINRRLGSRVASDSTISGSLLIDRPSRVRVSLYESGRPGSIVSPETPEPLLLSLNSCSTISRIISPQSNYPSSHQNNHHNSQHHSFSHSQNSSTNHHQNHLLDNNHHHHPNQDPLTLDLVKIMERKESVDIENPFRPGGELSREAETIVNLIKEGKPITPTTPTKELPSEKIPNGTSSPSSLSSNQNQAQPPKGNLIGTGLTSGKGDSHESQVTKKNTLNNQTTVDSNGHSERNGLGSELKGSSKIGNGNSLAIIKVERTIVSPDEPPKADIVTIDKKRKCVCCIIQ
ncbi:uncharacterized protein LOC107360542 [Tetranychus urticae]|nr:uncharacterized protein LOC107360542 [Tetranychus urticae]